MMGSLLDCGSLPKYMWAKNVEIEFNTVQI